jgi:hypothetical protein
MATMRETKGKTNQKVCGRKKTFHDYERNG